MDAGRDLFGINVRNKPFFQSHQKQPEQVDAPPNVLQVIERYRRELPSCDRRSDEREVRLSRASFNRVLPHR
jgi:hypothetical protein